MVSAFEKDIGGELPTHGVEHKWVAYPSERADIFILLAMTIKVLGWSDLKGQLTIESLKFTK